MPGLVRWPGKVDAGSTVDVPVIGSDLLPTILSVTGVDAGPLGGRALDGVDVSGVFSGKQKRVERPQPLFWRLDMAPNAKVALRVDDLKILADSERKTFELYDLAVDPRETSDLSKERSADLERMRDLLLKQIGSVEAEGPDWFKRLSPSGGKPPGQGVSPRKRKAD